MVMPSGTIIQRKSSSTAGVSISRPAVREACVAIKGLPGRSAPPAKTPRAGMDGTESMRGRRIGADALAPCRGGPDAVRVRETPAPRRETARRGRAPG
ncbi:hypothetical protein GCM10017643_01210 [Ancylobacter dichloromethanicus]|uniref:Uncharacterized protein n=1 Tax=Ancylobacter dichloromethanicus TaxID=518825 RepID=A0A9W6J385_9HYPH|nr:hypothetical protein GCM10017643_01210 [Ancylobacter dichloromethanicus]